MTNYTPTIEETTAIQTRARMLADLPFFVVRAGGDGRHGKFHSAPRNKTQRRYRKLLASRWSRDSQAWKAGLVSRDVRLGL